MFARPKGFRSGTFRAGEQYTPAERKMRKWESFAPLTHGQIFQTIGMSTMRAGIPHVALLSPTSLPERAPATLIYWFLIPGGVLIGEKEACLDERWNSLETARLRWDEGTVMHGLRVNR